MHRNQLFSGVALAVLAVAAGGTPAKAQQQTGAGEVIELTTINVEGERQDTRGDGDVTNDTPTVATKEETVLTTRVSREQLDSRQISDVTDISRLAPGVSYSSINGSFNVRGLDGPRVITSVDGVRIPWLNDGARGLKGGVSSFDFDTLSQADLVKGADSTVFGSGALGGTIAFRTLEPEDLIEPGSNFGGLTRGRFDSRDNSWTTDQAIAGRIDNTFVLVQGGYRFGDQTENRGETGGPGATRTKADPADYNQESVLVKVNQHIDGGHSIGLTGEHFERDTDIDALSTSTATYNPGATRDKVTARDRLSARYAYDGGGAIDSADAIVFWQRQELHEGFAADRRTTPVGPYGRFSDLEQTIYGANASALKLFETGEISHAFSFGGEIFASRTSQYSSGFDQCLPFQMAFPPCSMLHTNQADMPDVDGLTLGLFAQDTIALFDPRLRLIPGLRFDWYDYTPKDSPEYRDNVNYNGSLPPGSSDSALSGKLRLEGDATEGLTLYGQWAQAFRAPTPTELYLDYGGPNTYLILGNPDLKPETSNGFEVGALIGDDQAGGSVAAFYNRYEDFIDQRLQPGPPPPQYPMGATEYVNRANVEIYGLELSAHYNDESGWHGWGKFGAYVGRDIDEDLRLNTIPAAKAVVGVGYATGSWGADLILTVAAGRDYSSDLDPADPDYGTTPNSGSDVENLDAATPAYTLLDLVAWWSPRQVAGLTIRAGVYNILDELYYEDGFDLQPNNPGNPRPPKEYFSEPGRNFRVSATYKF